MVTLEQLWNPDLVCLSLYRNQINRSLQQVWLKTIRCYFLKSAKKTRFGKNWGFYAIGIYSLNRKIYIFSYVAVTCTFFALQHKYGSKALKKLLRNSGVLIFFEYLYALDGRKIKSDLNIFFCYLLNASIVTFPRYSDLEI